MMLAIEAYNNTVMTEDRLEGVRAFNEKRARTGASEEGLDNRIARSGVERERP